MGLRKNPILESANRSDKSDNKQPRFPLYLLLGLDYFFPMQSPVKTISRRLARAGLLAVSVMAFSSNTTGQEIVINYDEDKILPYTLPVLLETAECRKIDSTAGWEKRRKELLALFADQMYGRTPSEKLKPEIRVLKEVDGILDGLGSMKEVRLSFENHGHQVAIDVLIFLPESNVPVPCFLGLNFAGNHTVHPMPEITLSKSWMRPNQDGGIVDSRATEASRGKSASRWPVEMILKSGYGLVTAYYGDIDPDFDDEFQNGVHPLFYKADQTKPEPGQWGSIGAWAWGLSRIQDYLETDCDVDSSRVALLGHSRLGKTSLWAGAQDERFAIVISNNSGSGGAALNKRVIGENVIRINTSFPHWFCGNYKQYNNAESKLTFDQHQLIALMAPRPVYVASAEEDRWADPKGEFLSAREAGPVYNLYGLPAISSNSQMPEVNQPIHTTVGYHIRTGRHNVTDFDWEQYIRFANRHFWNQ